MARSLEVAVTAPRRRREYPVTLPGCRCHTGVATADDDLPIEPRCRHARRVSAGGFVPHRFAIWSIVCRRRLGADRAGSAQSGRRSRRRRRAGHAGWRPTEEIFGGLDLDILKSTLEERQQLEDSPATSASGRRHPMSAAASSCPSSGGWSPRRVDRGQRGARQRSEADQPGLFSYPGYAEILVGRALDAAITSNDPVRNPEETILEGLRRARRLSREQVATFASWDVFDAIAEHTEGATVSTRATSRWTSRAPTRAHQPAAARNRLAVGHTRLDAFTVNQAMAYLATPGRASSTWP